MDDWWQYQSSVPFAQRDDGSVAVGPGVARLGDGSCRDRHERSAFRSGEVESRVNGRPEVAAFTEPPRQPVARQGEDPARGQRLRFKFRKMLARLVLKAGEGGESALNKLDSRTPHHRELA